MKAKKQRPKKRKTPLTHRAHATLKKHPGITSDKLAKLLKVRAPAASKAVSALKARELAKFSTSKIGENLWKAKGKLKELSDFASGRLWVGRPLFNVSAAGRLDPT